MNPNLPEAYQGADFTSRFNEEFLVPENLSELELNLNLNLNLSFDLSAETAEHRKIIIDFYDDADWEPILIGRWKIGEHGFIFIPSDFITGLQRNQSCFEFKNAPWHDESFAKFLQQIKLDNYIHVHGQKIPVPKNLIVDKNYGYAWNDLLLNTNWHQGYLRNPKDFVILNPHTLSAFYDSYLYNNTSKKLIGYPGWLESNKNSALNIYVSRNISFLQWAKLLDTAKFFNVKLNIFLAPEIQLDPQIKVEIKLLDAPRPSEKLNLNKKVNIILSNDICKASNYYAKYASKIIEISEQDIADLLYIFDNPEIHTDGFTINEKKQALWQALAQGETVLLKGNFSNQLIDSLATFIIKDKLFLYGIEQEIPGKLILVTDNASKFNFCADIINHGFPDISTPRCRYNRKYLGKSS